MKPHVIWQDQRYRVIRVSDDELIVERCVGVDLLGVPRWTATEDFKQDAVALTSTVFHLLAGKS